MKIITKFILGCISVLATFINPIKAQPIRSPEFLYSIQIKNLTFDCDNVGSNGRVILHEGLYIKKNSNTSIDVYAKNVVNANYTFASTTLPKNPVSNYTYNNITSMSIIIPNYVALVVRPWRYSFKIDLNNRIIYISPSSQTTIYMKIINIFYYYNNRIPPRYPGCFNMSSIINNTTINFNNTTNITNITNITIFINQTNSYENYTSIVTDENEIVEDPYFDVPIFPDRPMPVLPNNNSSSNTININNTTITNITNISDSNIEIYPIPEHPGNTNDNSVQVESNTSDKFEGTKLTETQFWTLVGGLLGGILLISLLIKLIKKERWLIKEQILNGNKTQVHIIESIDFTSDQIEGNPCYSSDSSCDTSV